MLTSDFFAPQSLASIASRPHSQPANLLFLSRAGALPCTDTSSSPTFASHDSRVRWHGIPVPLPFDFAVASSGNFRRPTTRSELYCLMRRLREAVQSVNSLARARVRSDRGDHFALPSGRVSVTQASCLQSMLDRITTIGPRPLGLSPDDALTELIKTKDQYSLEPQHLAPYNPELLKLSLIHI